MDESASSGGDVDKSPYRDRSQAQPYEGKLHLALLLQFLHFGRDLLDLAL